MMKRILRNLLLILFFVTSVYQSNANGPCPIAEAMVKDYDIPGIKKFLSEDPAAYSKYESLYNTGDFFKTLTRSKTQNGLKIKILTDLSIDQIKLFAADFKTISSQRLAKFAKDPNVVEAWKALEKSPRIRVKEGNLEILSKIRSRSFGDDFFKEVAQLIQKSNVKQKLIDNLAKADEIFKTDIQNIKYTAAKLSGELEITNKHTKELIATITNGKLGKNKFLAQGTKIGDERYNLLQDGNVIGFWKTSNIGSVVSNVFFKNADEFSNTFDRAGNLSQTIRNQAFELYKQGNWKDLEELFKQYNLNGGWPPAYGGYNIKEISIRAGDKFDRYGGALSHWDGTGLPPLGGEFTSPIVNGKRYSFGQRALNKAEKDYDFYYEIEVLKDLPFKAEIADVIPWFGQVGKGKQAFWKIDKGANGYPKTWNQLVEEGYVKITIKKSPNSKYSKLGNIVISTDFFKDADKFAKTFNKAGNVNQSIIEEAYILYANHSWKDLEELFKQYNLNGGWPPAYGGYNIKEISIRAGDKFDRYGGALSHWDGTGLPPLGGEFTSPIVNGKRYSFGQRALNKAEKDYDFYYEIEVLKDLPFKAEIADVIPWFGQVGKGKQAFWKIDKGANGYPKTWNQLVEEGYVKITIKKSPNGKYLKFKDVVIDGN